MKTRLSRLVQCGLTLLELSIALALLAVLGAIAVPSLGSRLDQQRLYGAAEALVADVNEARFEAARQGRPLHVVMQSGDNWCWAVATLASCPCGQAGAAGSATLESRRGSRLRVDVQALGRARVCTLSGSAARYPVC